MVRFLDVMTCAMKFWSFQGVVDGMSNEISAVVVHVNLG